MLRSLLTAFRQHYPQGGLVSELVQIHDGLYIVRAAAMVDDRTLATGLAAHSRLETAEETACARALNHIGASAISDMATPSLAVPPLGVAPTPESGLASASPFSPSVSPPTTVANSAAPPPSPDPHLEGQSSGLTQGFTVDYPDAAPAPEPGATAVRPTVTPEPLVFEAIPTPSIDLSDIIAQTDVELQRLGWNVTQGREFLEKTYGKRSRHDLSDEELLEFLLFLETQPSPGP